MAQSSQDNSPVLLGVSWTWTVLAAIFVVVRMYSRLFLTRKLWWDDFWILVSLVCLYPLMMPNSSIL